jgi:chromosome segregation ATPase
MSKRSFWTLLFVVALFMGAQIGVGLAEKGESSEGTKVEGAKAEEPATEEKKAEEAAAEEKKAEEPAAEEAKAEEAAAEEKKAEEPAAEEKKSEETATEEKKAEEPAAEEKKAEEPAVEEKVEKKPAGKGELRDALEITSADVGTLSASVNSLYDQRSAKKGDEGKLKTLFDDFQGKLKTVHADVENLGATYAEMKKNMEAAFDDWKTVLEAMESKKIRKSGEKRRERSLKAFEVVKQDMQKIEESLASLAGRLKDVESFLTFDLTPGGVSEISSSLRDATKMSEGIQKDISKLLGKVGDLPNISSMQGGAGSSSSE